MSLTPDGFKPTPTDPMYFQQGLTVIGPGNGPGQVTTSVVNPIYCATLATAQVMAAVLAALNPKVVYHPPFGVWSAYSPFQQMGMVPWLLFDGGVLENAGLLASSWTHGYPVAWVEAEVTSGVQQDILAAQAAAAQQQG